MKICLCECAILLQSSKIQSGIDMTYVGSAHSNTLRLT
jgi:hypothetical protein